MFKFCKKIDYHVTNKSSTVQSLCDSAKSILSLLCLAERKGRFCLVTAFIPVPLSALHTVFAVSGVLDMSYKVLVTSAAFSAF